MSISAGSQAMPTAQCLSFLFLRVGNKGGAAYKRKVHSGSHLYVAAHGTHVLVTLTSISLAAPWQCPAHALRSLATAAQGQSLPTPPAATATLRAPQAPAHTLMAIHNDGDHDAH